MCVLLDVLLKKPMSKFPLVIYRLLPITLFICLSVNTLGCADLFVIPRLIDVGAMEPEQLEKAIELATEGRGSGGFVEYGRAYFHLNSHLSNWNRACPKPCVAGVAVVVMGESEIYFLEYPERNFYRCIVAVRYDEIVNVRLDKFGRNRHVIIRTTTEAEHTFQFQSHPKGWIDVDKTDDAFRFIDERLKQERPAQ